MLRENLKDAGQIIQNILTQPLSIPGASKDVSILTAAKRFNANDPATSDLKKVIDALRLYSSATDALLKELELLCDELKSV